MAREARDMRAMHDERERRDGRNGQEHRVRHEPTCDVRGSMFRTPRTSDLELSLVSLVPPVSRDYPAGVFPVVPHVRAMEASRATIVFPYPG